MNLIVSHTLYTDASTGVAKTEAIIEVQFDDFDVRTNLEYELQVDAIGNDENQYDPKSYRPSEVLKHGDMETLLIRADGNTSMTLRIPHEFPAAELREDPGRNAWSEFSIRVIATPQLPQACTVVSKPSRYPNSLISVA